MRLTKTAYLFGNEGQFIGNDPYSGRPIYADPKPEYPFVMEFEPYSADLAKVQYAINVVDIRYRMFTYPDERLTLNTEFVYKNKRYKIVYVMDYDMHYEVLISYEEEYNLPY